MSDEQSATLEPAVGTAFGLCRACDRLGACRLGLTVERLLEDGSVESELVCGVDGEGGPSVAHGGWTAAAFDDLLGHVPKMHGKLAVTGRLAVTYVKPVPVDRQLGARCWIDRVEGSRWFVKGEIMLASTGAVLARGEAVMVLRDPQHFERHEQWLADQDAAAG